MAGSESQSGDGSESPSPSQQQQQQQPAATQEEDSHEGAVREDGSGSPSPSHPSVHERKAVLHGAPSPHGVPSAAAASVDSKDAAAPGLPEEGEGALSPLDRRGRKAEQRRVKKKERKRRKKEEEEERAKKKTCREAEPGSGRGDEGDDGGAEGGPAPGCGPAPARGGSSGRQGGGVSGASPAAGAGGGSRRGERRHSEHVSDGDDPEGGAGPGDSQAGLDEGQAAPGPTPSLAPDCSPSSCSPLDIIEVPDSEDSGQQEDAGPGSGQQGEGEAEPGQQEGEAGSEWQDEGVGSEWQEEEGAAGSGQQGEAGSGQQDEGASGALWLLQQYADDEEQDAGLTGAGPASGGDEDLSEELSDDAEVSPAQPRDEREDAHPPTPLSGAGPHDEGRTYPCDTAGGFRPVTLPSATSSLAAAADREEPLPSEGSPSRARRGRGPAHCPAPSLPWLGKSIAKPGALPHGGAINPTASVLAGAQAAPSRVPTADPQQGARAGPRPSPGRGGAAAIRAASEPAVHVINIISDDDEEEGGSDASPDQLGERFPAGQALCPPGPQEAEDGPDPFGQHQALAARGGGRQGGGTGGGRGGGQHLALDVQGGGPGRSRAAAASAGKQGTAGAGAGSRMRRVRLASDEQPAAAAPRANSEVEAISDSDSEGAHEGAGASLQHQQAAGEGSFVLFNRVNAGSGAAGRGRKGRPAKAGGGGRRKSAPSSLACAVGGRLRRKSGVGAQGLQQPPITNYMP